MTEPKPTHHGAVLRMLRAANGGWVTLRYLNAALGGLGARHNALKECMGRVREELEAGEVVENIRGFGYRLRRAGA